MDADWSPSVDNAAFAARPARRVRSECSRQYARLPHDPCYPAAVAVARRKNYGRACLPVSTVSGSRSPGKRIELSSAVFVTRCVASRLVYLGVRPLDGQHAGVQHGGSKHGGNATGVMVTGRPTQRVGGLCFPYKHTLTARTDLLTVSLADPRPLPIGYSLVCSPNPPHAPGGLFP